MELVAYCFDHSVLYAGHWIEAELSKIDEHGQPVHTLEELLGVKEPMSKDDQLLLLRMKLNAVVGAPRRD